MSIIFQFCYPISRCMEKSAKSASLRKLLVKMGCLMFVLLIVVSAALIVGLDSITGPKPLFRVDYAENSFSMNGEPFRYVSGSFHYFRALPQTWKTKLRTMRAAGLNAVDTYVEWAFHNPKDGVYNFNDTADLEQFLRYATEEDLYIILRPGPYICAERDNGGLPYWLFSKYPDIKPRTSDPNFQSEVSKWYAELMPRIQPFLFGNGGRIIMVQVENEYAAFSACDKNYLNWLRDETAQFVKNDAVLFTTDIPNERISCGKIDGVFATTDFGADRVHEIDKIWETLRTVQPNGPLVNSEFYPGWLTHWQEDNQRRDPDTIAGALRKILESGASVNIYMFFGGTNFGYTAGANNWGDGSYVPDITSYDYDAPMDEAGDPTIKYLKLRNVINSFLTLPAVPVPDPQPKMTLDSVQLIPVDNILSENSLQHLGRSFIADKPLTFEEIDQFSGLVLYETVLPTLSTDPSLLTINDLRDRGIILVDGKLIGILSRQNNIKSLPIHDYDGKKLQILVENQGRINFEIANDKKGIIGNVTVQQSDGKQIVLKHWSSLGIDEDTQKIKSLIESRANESISIPNNGKLQNGPVIFFGNFKINKHEILDTYLDTSGWGKGVIYINGFNLGRYWPLVGPQITLYVPKEILKKGENCVVLIEYQKTNANCTIHFTDTAKLDGKNK